MIPEMASTYVTSFYLTSVGVSKGWQSPSILIFLTFQKLYVEVLLVQFNNFCKRFTSLHRAGVQFENKVLWNQRRKHFPLSLFSLRNGSENWGPNESPVVLHFLWCTTSHTPFNQNENYSPELHFYQRKANVVISPVKSNLTGMIQ